MEELYSYDEFGQGGQVSQNQSKNVNTAQTFTYTGYQKDSVANTYYAQAREYKPEIGGFVSEDVIRGVIVYPITMNHYSYCANQPLVLVDENGLFMNIVAGIVVGGIIGGAAKVISNVASNKEWNEGLGVAVAKGAIAGGIGYGVGRYFDNRAVSEMGKGFKKSILRDVGVKGGNINTAFKQLMNGTLSKETMRAFYREAAKRLPQSVSYIFLKELISAAPGDLVDYAADWVEENLEACLD